MICPLQQLKDQRWMLFLGGRPLQKWEELFLPESYGFADNLSLPGLVTGCSYRNLWPDYFTLERKGKNSPSLCRPETQASAIPSGAPKVRKKAQKRAEEMSGGTQPYVQARLLLAGNPDTHTHTLLWAQRAWHHPRRAHCSIYIIFSCWKMRSCTFLCLSLIFS